LSRWRAKPDGTWEKNEAPGKAAGNRVQVALVAGIVFGLAFALAIRLLS
jgi:hypothetical protein